MVPGHKTSPQQPKDPKRPKPKGCKFIQINLHYSGAVMVLLCQKIVKGETNTALIQESRVYGNHVWRLCNRTGTLLSEGPGTVARPCIL
jgi:hypothetical protein